jgi:hypothetical protein
VVCQVAYVLFLPDSDVGLQDSFKDSEEFCFNDMVADEQEQVDGSV